MTLLADGIRVATYNVELHRKGPGLMLRDILRGDDRARAVARAVAATSPDILVLQGVDYDLDLHGIRALRDVLSAHGTDYPELFALRPNTGLATDFDLNGDGRRNEAEDAQGYGHFEGQRGMAILSRWPILQDETQDFSTLLWKDLPGANLPEVDGTPFPSQGAHDAQRLSSTGHWIVPIAVPDRPVSLLAYAATPPVFDGPEDRNGLRNADETLLWEHVLSGDLGRAPAGRFFVVGNANLDPERGEGRHHAIRKLIENPLLQDPRPLSDSGSADTVDWPEPNPGNLRVSYVLPSIDWLVLGSGVHWTDDPDTPRHKLVWVDVVARSDPES